MDNALLLDLKYAGRSLWRAKGFATTVVLTFAVCIAANSALFAIVDGVVLRPLPVPDANSILIMSNEYPKAGALDLNYSSSGDYFDRLKEMTAFETQAMFRQRGQTVEVNALPQRMPGMSVTPSWFRLLRVSPEIGRPFAEELTCPGCACPAGRAPVRGEWARGSQRAAADVPALRQHGGHAP